MSEIGGVIAMMVFCGVIFVILFWFAGRGGSAGVEQDIDDWIKRKAERGNAEPRRKEDETHLPKWVVKARRDMEKKR